MLEEVTVTVDDRPGILAEIGELLGRSGVNIHTLCAATHNGAGVVHLVVDDEEDASEVLAANGFKVDSRPVLTATLDDSPGELGAYCRKLAGEGINITSAYVARRNAGETELVFAVDDIDAARQI